MFWIVTSKMIINDAGDWPLLTTKANESINVTIESVTEGEASFSKWRLHLPYDGVNLISDELATTNLTTEQV